MTIESQFSDIFLKIIKSFPKDENPNINEILLIAFMHHAHKNARQDCVLLSADDLGDEGYEATESLFNKNMLDIRYQPEQGHPGWLFLTMKSKEVANALGGFCSIFLSAPLPMQGEGDKNKPERSYGVLKDFFGWGLKSRESCDDFFKSLFKAAQSLH